MTVAAWIAAIVGAASGVSIVILALRLAAARAANAKLEASLMLRMSDLARVSNRLASESAARIDDAQRVADVRYGLMADIKELNDDLAKCATPEGRLARIDRLLRKASGIGRAAAAAGGDHPPALPAVRGPAAAVERPDPVRP